MSTHNICFCGDTRKILCVYPIIWSCYGTIFTLTEQTNNVDPDHTLQNVASNQDLLCLPLTWQFLTYQQYI